MSNSSHALASLEILRWSNRAVVTGRAGRPSDQRQPRRQNSTHVSRGAQTGPTIRFTIVAGNNVDGKENGMPFTYFKILETANG